MRLPTNRTTSEDDFRTARSLANWFQRPQETIGEKSLKGRIKDFIVKEDEPPAFVYFLAVCGISKISRGSNNVNAFSLEDKLPITECAHQWQRLK